MRRVLAALCVATLLSAPPAHAENEPSALGARAVDAVLRPGYAAFAEQTARLLPAAETCDADTLRPVYHDVFDAWLQVEAVVFGPIEAEDRRFAILFWPDSKGFVAKALTRLSRAEDPVVDDPASFAKVSVAARGFPALERLLWSDAGPRAFDGEEGPYRCRLAVAVSRELDRNAQALADAWRADAGPADELTRPGPDNTRYRSEVDVARDLFRSLDGGLEKIAALRIGRPLGTTGKERPRRAETWRSGRSTRNIQRALEGLEALYQDVFAPALPEQDRVRVDAAFARMREVAGRLPSGFEPIASDPQIRFRVEAVKSRVEELQRLVRQTVAPAVGVTIGFNALDGD